MGFNSGFKVLNERESLSELRVFCAVAGERRRPAHPSRGVIPRSSQPVTKGRNNLIKI